MAEKKIVIIEDDRDLVKALSIRLRANGYQTAFAVDGASAVKTVQEEMPDLILLDLGLPGGDGHLVIDRLRALPHLSGIPVIVVTGRSQYREKSKSLKEGAAYFFEKPVDHEDLLAVIGTVLGEPVVRN